MDIDCLFHALYSHFKDDIQSYASDDEFEGRICFPVLYDPLILFIYLDDSSDPTVELEVNSLDEGRVGS